MGDVVVSRPAQQHHCGVNDYGIWSEPRPLSPDSDLYKQIGARYTYHFIHEHDAPGTVRACTECGKTWVAGRSRDPGMMLTVWSPEGRFARWLRVRRQRRG